MKNSTNSLKHLRFEVDTLKDMLEEQRMDINVLHRQNRILRALVYKYTGEDLHITRESVKTA